MYFFITHKMTSVSFLISSEIFFVPPGNKLSISSHISIMSWR